MKLTKKELERLIMEEMRRFRPPEFDPRAKKEYPHHADKLSTIYKSNPAQGRSLSHGLNDGEFDEKGDPKYEPIDIPVPDEPDDDWQFWNAPFMRSSNEYKNMMSGPWQAAKKQFYVWAQTQPHFQKRNAPGVRSIFHIPKLQRYEELKNFLNDTGDQESYDVMKRTLERSHMASHLNVKGEGYFDNVFMKESTEQQKTQQRKDNWDARGRQRAQMKIKIKRAQNIGEPSFKSKKSDFDPIKDLGKAMKKQGYEVIANGEEIEE